MRNTPDTGTKSALDQLAGTYVKARWYLGFGMIALTLLLVTIGTVRSEIWVMTAAGAVILAHTLAMRIWKMTDSTVALLVDITATGIAAMVIGSASHNHLPAALTFVGAATLISLFTDRSTRVLILIYTSVLILASMLLVEDWDPLAAADEYIAAMFVSFLVVGVISAIRGKLVEVEAARAQTIGVVSHELRNHLTGVVGAVELITDETTRLGPDEADELLQLAYQQVVEAEAVIEDLLTASRAERGVLDAVSEPVDLCPLTETVIRRTAVEDSDIVYDFSHGPVWAMADPLRYKQIVRNLLTNAQRYGGDTIWVSVETGDVVVSVKVSDNGDGVDEDRAPSLFLPYHGGRQIHRVSGSTGLGLWISRSLAYKMNGDLTYDRSGDLSIFELTLPAAASELPEPLQSEHSLRASRS